MDFINDTLVSYGFTTTIAYALRLFLKNPYEGLLLVDKDARILSMPRSKLYEKIKRYGL